MTSAGSTGEQEATLLKTHRPPFDSGKGFFAARPFTFEGETFALGDPFPWEKLGCSDRKLRQLWDRRRIDCGTYTPPVVKPERKRREKKQKDAAPAGAESNPLPVGEVVTGDGESPDNRFE